MGYKRALKGDGVKTRLEYSTHRVNQSWIVIINIGEVVKALKKVFYF